MVSVEETGEHFNYTLEELLEKARGKYQSGLDKEGIVVRAQQAGHNPAINHKMSFKVINNDFLKKEKDVTVQVVSGKYVLVGTLHTSFS